MSNEANGTASVEVKFNATPEAAPAPETKPEPKKSDGKGVKFVDANIATKPGAKVLVEQKEEKPDPLAELVQALKARFEDVDPENEKLPGPRAKAFAAQNIFVRLEDKPVRRVRIGVNQGIHTYVLITERGGKLVAQLYMAVPKPFNDLIVPQLKELGITEFGQFTRPSGI